MKTFILKKGQLLTGRLLRSFFVVAVAALVVVPLNLSAHCDSYDGPLIKDALRAIETNNVTLVLKWVDKEHEPEISSLFNKTVALKKGDREVFELVQKYFLETLVRVHREGEGAPYTGLKPAGQTEPIVVMSDQALEQKNINNLLEKLNAHLSEVVREKYNQAVETSRGKDQSAEAGRAFVKAYVEYTHLLEAVHHAIEAAGQEHQH